LLAGYAIVAVPQVLSESPVSARLLATLVLGLILVALTVIDVATFRLPDALTIPLSLIGLFVGWALDLEPALIVRAAAGVTGYAALWTVGWLYYRFRRNAGLGLGDAKLFAAAGTWLGPQGQTSVLLLACLSALCFVALQCLSGRSVDRRHRIAFGPFIAGGIWLVWLYGAVV